MAPMRTHMQTITLRIFNRDPPIHLRLNKPATILTNLCLPELLPVRLEPSLTTSRSHLPATASLIRMQRLISTLATNTRRALLYPMAFRRRTISSRRDLQLILPINNIRPPTPFTIRTVAFPLYMPTVLRGKRLSELLKYVFSTRWHL